MKITKSILINCSKQELWTWLTDFEKIKKWNSTILKQEEVSSGNVRPGYLTKVLIKEGKKEFWYDNEILEYIDNTFLKISLRGGNLGKEAMYVKYVITEFENQVELTLSSSWKPKELFLKLMKPVIKFIAKKNTNHVLLELRNQINQAKNG